MEFYEPEEELNPVAAELWEAIESQTSRELACISTEMDRVTGMGWWFLGSDERERFVLITGSDADFPNFNDPEINVGIYLVDDSEDENAESPQATFLWSTFSGDFALAATLIVAWARAIDDEAA